MAPSRGRTPRDTTTGSAGACCLQLLTVSLISALTMCGRGLLLEQEVASLVLQHPEVRSVKTSDARATFWPTEASSWARSSGFSQQEPLFLDRAPGSARGESGSTPPVADQLPTCVSPGCRARQSLLEGGWRQRTRSARRFAIPLVLPGFW